MNTPKKIEKCPIIDSVIEIRFESLINPNAVFGVFFNEFKDQYPNVEALPILQLPEPLRMTDPGLQYKAHYKIEGGGRSIQIGPNALVFGAKMPYEGWEVFSSVVFENIGRALKLDLIKHVSRLGIRYINFFDLDIFQHLNLDLSVNDKKLNLSNTLIRTEVGGDEFKSTLQIGNNARMLNKEGSLIDVDTFKLYDSSFDFKSNLKSEISKGHLEEKETFFSLLNPKFLQTLNPVYQ